MRDDARTGCSGTGNGAMGEAPNEHHAYLSHHNYILILCMTLKTDVWDSKRARAEVCLSPEGKLHWK